MSLVSSDIKWCFSVLKCLPRPSSPRDALNERKLLEVRPCETLVSDTRVECPLPVKCFRSQVYARCTEWNEIGKDFWAFSFQDDDWLIRCEHTHARIIEARARLLSFEYKQSFAGHEDISSAIGNRAQLTVDRPTKLRRNHLDFRAVFFTVPGYILIIKIYNSCY